MERNTVTEIIKVPSIMLTSNIKSNILSIIREKEGTCIEKYGCIMSISSLDEILNAKVCISDEMNHFTVIYSFITFKPLIRVPYQSNVLKYYNDGMIVAVKGCCSIRALIEKPSRKYECNEIVTVILDEIKFVESSFICVGKLTQENDSFKN